MDDTIDIIATDHAPHTKEEKQQSYFKSPSGGPLVQHSLLAMLEFVCDNKMSIEKVVDMMCHKPAICFNVFKRGFIRKSYFADLVLLDMGHKSPVTTESLLYKCKWSPFEGYIFRSKVAYTFVNGQLAYNGTKVLDNIRGMRLEFRNP